MSNITDTSLEDLLTVNSHYVMDSLGEAVDFDGKSDAQREEIMKAILKSLEIATVLTCKFFDAGTFQADKVGEVAKELKAENFSKANEIVAKEE